eukprot:CAMPEP_0197027714 /NCGR_PEP_ID=MMETSP1384-20130603/7590_1 /TAXON_ID=29189 /ORGANISM="Ammonia sp." /LENGTH=147 /DNA_ID=CAMNT_0042456605 /DNA_START=118 /DNA_END=561 /DNA_ORIENTATION=+
MANDKAPLQPVSLFPTLNMAVDFTVTVMMARTGLSKGEVLDRMVHNIKFGNSNLEPLSANFIDGDILRLKYGTRASAVKACNLLLENPELIIVGGVAVKIISAVITAHTRSFAVDCIFEILDKGADEMIEVGMHRTMQKKKHCCILL